MVTKIQRNSKLLLSAFVIVVLGLNITQLISLAVQNVGAIWQNSALAESNESQRVDALHKASNLFQLAIRIDADNQRAWRDLGFSHFYLLEEQQALTVWTEHGNMGDELLKRAHLAEAQDDVAMALQWYDLVTKLSPTRSEGWYSLALFYKKQNDLNGAIGSFTKAIEFTSFDDCVVGDSYFHLGAIYQGQATQMDLDLAVEMFELAIDRDTFCDDKLRAEVFFRLGEIYTWQSYPKADVIAQFEEAARLNPNHHWAKLRLNYVRFYEDGDLETAVKEIESVIAAWEKSNSPNLKWGYRFLGDIYLQSQLYPNALHAYQAAFQLDPTDQDIAEKIDWINAQKDS